jgi:hypothetical protein
MPKPNLREDFLILGDLRFSKDGRKVAPAPGCNWHEWRDTLRGWPQFQSIKPADLDKFAQHSCDRGIRKAPMLRDQQGWREWFDGFMERAKAA